MLFHIGGVSKTTERRRFARCCHRAAARCRCRAVCSLRTILVCSTIPEKIATCFKSDFVPVHVCIFSDRRYCFISTNPILYPVSWIHRANFTLYYHQQYRAFILDGCTERVAHLGYSKGTVYPHSRELRTMPP